MQTSDILSIVAIIISVLSFGLSFIYSIIRNRKQDTYIKRQDELIQRQLEKDEKEKVLEKVADLTAELVSIGNNKKVLRIANIGKALAKKVMFKLIDTTNWFLAYEDGLFPLDLSSGRNIDLPIIVGVDCLPKGKCHFSWEDETGQQEKDIVLTIY